MSAPKSFGEELLRIIREEIADYDARKAKEAEAARLQRVADKAQIEAEFAARSAAAPDFSRLPLFGPEPRVIALNAAADRLAKGRSGATYNINTAPGTTEGGAQ